MGCGASAEANGWIAADASLFRNHRHAEIPGDAYEPVNPHHHFWRTRGHHHRCDRPRLLGLQRPAADMAIAARRSLPVPSQGEGRGAGRGDHRAVQGMGEALGTRLWGNPLCVPHCGIGAARYVARAAKKGGATPDVAYSTGQYQPFPHPQPSFRRPPCREMI